MVVGALVADRFEVLGLAGSGGMGQVWRAVDRTDGGVVALKLLKPEAQDQAARFSREARLLAELVDPAIVRHIAHGATAAGELYLAMEWLEGEDLAARLARGPLGIDETIGLGARVAAALRAAHARGVVHRDIKPSNVFLPHGALGDAKLLDFGIARLSSATFAATHAGALLGTPGYMSPEQARGEAGVDARTDLFALGALLWECLAGRPAFVGDHALAILAKVLFDEPPPLPLLRPDVPEPLARLIGRLLAKEPGARPADAAALAAELATSRHGAPAAFAERIGGDELRRLFVVVATETRDDPPAQDPALASTEAPVQRQPPEALARLGASLGVQLERLLDGSVVATLTAPGSAADAASRAARAALALHHALPGAHVAVATGRGVVADRLPIGEVIDRAVALVHASGARVRIDEATGGLLDARFVIESDRGGFALIGEREAASHVRTLLGRPTPCVGRDRELGLLTGTFAECKHESLARAVLVTAPPGVGKSRLRHEFVSGVAAPVEIWLARGDTISAGSPFGMLAQLVRRAAALHDGEAPELARRKLRARVARHVAPAEVGRTTEFLGEVAGVPFPDDDNQPLAAARRDAQLMGDQLRRAWETWLAAECAAQPVILVLEDLHWGDLPTVKHVDWALRRLAEAPLFVLATARPEVHATFPELWREHGLQEIHLPQLGRRACERLVKHVLGDPDPATTDRIVALATGNAFYLEELIRASAEGRHDLPESVLAMAQVRFEALDPEARRVLRAAAVFGEVCWDEAVATLLGDGAPVGLLDGLLERELLERRPDPRFAGVTEYAFRHALLREAAYAALTEHDRRVGHRLAAAWLERAGERDAMTLGEHHERGGEPTRAARWYRRAAEQALEGGDFDGALARAARARACTEDGDERLALALIEMEAFKWTGRFDQRADKAEQVLRDAPRGSVVWCRAVGEVTALDQDLAAREQDLMSFTPTGEAIVPYLVSTARVLTQSCIHQRPDDALAPLYARLDEVSVAISDPAVTGWLEQAIAFRAAALGDCAASIAHFEAAQACFEAAGDRRNALAQLLDLANARLECGDYAANIPPLRAALAQIEALGLWRLHGFGVSMLSWSLFRSGDVAEARAIIQEGRDRSHAKHRPNFAEYLAALTEEFMALLDRAVGDLAGAEAHARTAVEKARLMSPVLADPRGTLALVLVDLGRAEEALAITEGAALRRLTVMNDSEGGPAHIVLSRIEALRALGRVDEAQRAAILGLEIVDGIIARVSDRALGQAMRTRVDDYARIIAHARALGVR